MDVREDGGGDRLVAEVTQGNEKRNDEDETKRVNERS